MATKPKSMANDLFSLYVETYKLGDVFTAQEFHVIAHMKGLGASEGAVHGFIHRAKTNGNIEAIGIIINKESNYRVYEYMAMTHDPWNFKAPSRGSFKGRKIHNKQMGDKSALPLHGNTGAKVARPPTNNDIIGEIAPIKPATTTSKVIDTVEAWAASEVQAGTAKDSIYLRLNEISALVHQLEGKALAEYTDQEIINELNSRLNRVPR